MATQSNRNVIFIISKKIVALGKNHVYTFQACYSHSACLSNSGVVPQVARLLTVIGRPTHHDVAIEGLNYKAILR